MPRCSTPGSRDSAEKSTNADSNRESKTTRIGTGGACATTGGTTQSYTYDEADRLIGPTYDAFGRIESLPAEFAGGKALTTEYFANNMIAKQTQNAVTNTFQLDASGRQRQREQTGGVAGIEIFHYDGPGDSPSWTALGSTWSRNVAGIGGELVAVQESSGTTTFKLTDLHGDVIASASSSPTVTALLGTYRSDEFGEPVSGSAGRFGWLGGKSRRTELQSGVIQMGARSYIPQLGRFLTPDPVPGGSANAYDYANQDPVNGFDLGGEKPYDRSHNVAIRGGVHVWSRKIGRGQGGRGKFNARLFVSSRLTKSGATYRPEISHVTFQIEKVPGSSNVVAEHQINLHKQPDGTAETQGWNNWQAGTAPISVPCQKGVEYQFTIRVEFEIDNNVPEEDEMRAQEVCGHGRY
jgi:RHS repeat-associated protein